MKKSLLFICIFFMSISFIKSQALDFGIDTNTKTSIITDNNQEIWGSIRNIYWSHQEGYIEEGNIDCIWVVMNDYSKYKEISWKFYNGWGQYVKMFDSYGNECAKSRANIQLDSRAASEAIVVATAIHHDGTEGPTFVRTFYKISQ